MTSPVYGIMKKEMKARQDGGWSRVEWELPEAPVLRDLEVVHGRLVYLNPKVRESTRLNSNLKFHIFFRKCGPHPLVGLTPKLAHYQNKSTASPFTAPFVAIAGCLCFRKGIQELFGNCAIPNTLMGRCSYQ